MYFILYIRFYYCTQGEISTILFSVMIQIYFISLTFYIQLYVQWSREPFYGIVTHEGTVALNSKYVSF
jgi:hypothetical protein